MTHNLKEINSERESCICCDGSCFRKVVGQGLCQDNISAAVKGDAMSASKSSGARAYVAEGKQVQRPWGEKEAGVWECKGCWGV